jgi:hypothetical protein
VGGRVFGACRPTDRLCRVPQQAGPGITAVRELACKWVQHPRWFDSVGCHRKQTGDSSSASPIPLELETYKQRSCSGKPAMPRPCIKHSCWYMRVCCSLQDGTPAPWLHVWTTTPAGQVVYHKALLGVSRDGIMLAENVPVARVGEVSDLAGVLHSYPCATGTCCNVQWCRQYPWPTTSQL